MTLTRLTQTPKAHQTKVLAAALASLPLMLPEAAVAQQSEGVSALMEEVVVTARKREGHAAPVTACGQIKQ